MQYNYNRDLTANARKLRKNMTPEEKHLWYDFLKRLPVTVNRQKNIGDYIVDFYIAGARLVIEIDGRQHRLPEHRATDEKRDFELRQLGNRVLRYTNEDIQMRFEAVCLDILQQCGLTMDMLKPVK